MARLKASGHDLTCKKSEESQPLLLDCEHDQQDARSSAAKPLHPKQDTDANVTDSSHLNINLNDNLSTENFSKEGHGPFFDYQAANTSNGRVFTAAQSPTLLPPFHQTFNTKDSPPAYVANLPPDPRDAITMPGDAAGSDSTIDGNRVTALDNPPERISAVLPTITTEIPKSLFKQNIQAPGTWFLLDSLFLLCINGYWVCKLVWIQTEVFILEVLLVNIGVLFPMMVIKCHSSEDDLAMWLACQFFGSVLFWAVLRFVWMSTVKMTPSPPNQSLPSLV